MTILSERGDLAILREIGDMPILKYKRDMTILLLRGDMTLLRKWGDMALLMVPKCHVTEGKSGTCLYVLKDGKDVSLLREGLAWLY